jgi:hypothetical protein
MRSFYSVLAEHIHALVLLLVRIFRVMCEHLPAHRDIATERGKNSQLSSRNLCFSECFSLLSVRPGSDVYNSHVEEEAFG